MIEKENKSTELMQKEGSTSLEVTSYDQFNSLEDMMAFGDKIAKSDLSPLKNASDVMAALTLGKELGLKPMQALLNIYPIKGRATIGVHIISALLLKAGVSYEVLDDYAPLYRFADKSQNVYGEEEVITKKGFLQVITPLTPLSLNDPNKIQVFLLNGAARIGDRKTSIKFTRKLRQGDGSVVTQTITLTRYFSDYTHLHGKDNWINNPKGMLFNRVLATGGRAIASDATLGLYLPDEAEDIEQIETEKIKEKITEEVEYQEVKYVMLIVSLIY